jgi:hypothetical protein
MKIRRDYVTNSSSTSYIIICDGEFTKDNLSEFMGVQRHSPLYPLVNSLYDAIINGRQSAQSANKESLEDFFLDGPSPELWERVIRAQRQGRQVWVGSLSSEETPAESLFCCSAFEWENDKMYINALNCVW